MARPWSPPAAMNVSPGPHAFGRGGIGTGTPVPVWPELYCPQPYASPPPVRARPNAQPATPLAGSAAGGTEAASSPG
ncbi:hypothetical protein AB0C33_13490 [Nonomuraea sp. NPDC048881]|uniref:hypothetical protein n=1 Tax=Nonomuraea sp. NPDC048881 TaxID=3155030 RepID=UPI0033C403D7